MAVGLFFWILMLVWVLFGFFVHYRAWPAGSPGVPVIYPLGGHFLLFILILLLGWHAFGAPLKF